MSVTCTMKLISLLNRTDKFKMSIKCYMFVFAVLAKYSPVSVLPCLPVARLYCSLCSLCLLNIHWFLFYLVK